METRTDVHSPRNAFAISTNDSVDLTHPTTAIYVGTSGDIKVDTVGGDTVTFTGVNAGDWFSIQATRVYATGTTADNLIGGY